MRLFFAIDLPDDVRGRLVRVQEQWGKGRDRYCPAWTKPESLHATLKFLGDVNDVALTNLLVRMRELPSRGPFMIRTGGVQYFPLRGPIRVLAVQLGGDTGRLHQLADLLESFCEAEGFPRERRPFNPHVTIGRSRNGLPWYLRTGHQDESWPDASPMFPVREIVLYESHLKPGGPEYVKVAAFPV